MKRLIILSAFPFLLLSVSVRAQQISVHVQGGLITGTPYFPPPEGATGRPGTGLVLGGELGWELFPGLSLRAGGYYAEKGGEFTSPVAGKYDAVTGLLGIDLPIGINVNYTGTVKGAYDMAYVDIPLYLSYRLHRWGSIGLGYQYSHLIRGQLDGSADIRVLAFTFRNQEFDQSHLILDRDHALLMEGTIHMLPFIHVTIRGGLGLSPMMREDPENPGLPKNYYVGFMLGITPMTMDLKRTRVLWLGSQNE